MQIIKLKQAIEAGKIKMLVYGEAGAGKTHLIGTLPGRGLVISAESGLLSLRRLIEVDPELGERVDVVTVKTLKEVKAVYAHLSKSLAGGACEYDWVALDSLSEIAEAVLSHEKTQVTDPRQAYGGLLVSMDDLTKSFRDLPIDVGMICKSERVKDEATGRISTQIMMPGNKLTQALPYLFDEVLYLFAETVQDAEGKMQTKRFLQTVTGRVVAKDRSGKLDPLEDADLGKVLAKIRGKA